MNSFYILLLMISLLQHINGLLINNRQKDISDYLNRF